MVSLSIRPMHNSYGPHASRETAPSRFEPVDHLCGDRRGTKRHQSVRPTIAQSTGGQPRPSAGAFHVSGRAGGSLAFRVELTLRGRKILQELEQILPKIEGLVVPSVFDPKKERSSFRISGPDNVCMALLPHLCRRYATERYKVNFDFLPWQADAVDMLERGKLDLILHIDDGLLPSHFSSERLYREDWICAVARQSEFGKRLTLKQYLAAEHLTVTTLPSVQNIPDKQLAALGAKRRSAVRMPYFGAALNCLAGTELVLTLTNGMRQMVENNS